MSTELTATLPSLTTTDESKKQSNNNDNVSVVEQNNRKVAIITLYEPKLLNSSSISSLSDQFFSTICDTNLDRLVEKTIDWVKRHQELLLNAEMKRSVDYSTSSGDEFECRNIKITRKENNSYDNKRHATLTIEGEIWKKAGKSVKKNIIEIMLGGKKFVCEDYIVTEGDNKWEQVISKYKKEPATVSTIITFLKKSLIMYNDAIEIDDNNECILRLDDVSFLNKTDTDRKPYSM